MSDGFLLAKNGTETFSIKPQVPKKLAIGDPAFPYSVNELQNTFEEQYLFREGTAAQWLKKWGGSRRGAQPGSPRCWLSPTTTAPHRGGCP